jgi:hypothetical protein
MKPWSPARSGAVAIAAMWLLGVAGAICSGWSHGYVTPRLRASLPYEWPGVLWACAVMGLEALALHAVLFRLRRWGRLRRTLLAVGLFGALSAYDILTIVTDMPGWYYVSRAWSLFMLLVLVTALCTQSVARVAVRLRARRA